MELTEAIKALNDLQDEVWKNLGAYSNKLGWGLSGIQPECWTLLDTAVDELVQLRKQYTIKWEQYMGGGRGVDMQLSGDLESVRSIWIVLNAQAEMLKSSARVRQVKVSWRGAEFDPKKAWPRGARD
jgi:hypothetical protein